MLSDKRELCKHDHSRTEITKILTNNTQLRILTTEERIFELK